MASLDDTVVLVTAVARREAKPGQDFFPLTVDYQEKTYAAGKIPGGFFKREGRPSEKETLTCRLIDRPIRPLFPDGFYNEVQIIATVMSVDPEIDPDIPAMIGASAALALSGVPFDGPIGAARVGYIDGQYVLNPTKTELTTSAAQPGRRRHRSRRADGRIGGQRAARGSDARRRGVRPPAAAGGDQPHRRAGRGMRQAAVGLAAGGQEPGADRPGDRRRRRPAARGLRAAPEAGAAAAAEGNQRQGRGRVHPRRRLA